MRIHAYGRGALLVELASLSEVLGLHAELRGDPPHGLVETVPTARTLLVSFDPRRTTPAAIATEVRGRRVVGHRFEVGPEVEIHIRYDGEDLDEVARLTGWRPAQIVRRHLARTYVVAFIGFAPGFYFLAGGDDALAVPRRSAPRTDVPRGAVGLAGEFTGIYPRTGPGGWQVIGHTPAGLWDPDRTPSAMLTPGTRVRFLDAT
ncbi:MAG: allophanate hydrolase subunit 1 [Pseudonocardia sp.]|nr:allophanate hydrolase subunit 1 [Pseudonocardia sp.]